MRALVVFANENRTEPLFDFSICYPLHLPITREVNTLQILLNFSKILWLSYSEFGTKTHVFRTTNVQNFTRFCGNCSSRVGLHKEMWYSGRFIEFDLNNSALFVIQIALFNEINNSLLSIFSTSKINHN